MDAWVLLLHTEAAQNFQNVKTCKVTPARPCAERLKDTQLHKHEGSREELLEARTMGE